MVNPGENSEDHDRLVKDMFEESTDPLRLIIMLFGEEFSLGLKTLIRSKVEKIAKGFNILNPSTLADFSRASNNPIRIAIVEDSYAPIDCLLVELREIRKVHEESAIPLVFLTKSPLELTAAYHRYLLMYRKVDRYIDYGKLSPDEVISAIEQCLEIKGGQPRRMRRYHLSIPITYSVFEGKEQAGVCLNLSISGALLRLERTRDFKIHEQIVVQFSTRGILPPKEGEFMRLSAKVRRTVEGVSEVGVSWEYATYYQIEKLNDYINHVNPGKKRARN